MTNHESPVALLDTNILYPNLMRDILLEAAKLRIFNFRWSRNIRQELLRAYRRQNSDRMSRRFEEHTLRLMDVYFRRLMISGYEYLLPDIHLPDPDDRHVLAAAIHANCDYLVTQNLRDFPAPVCAQFGIEVVHPDNFLLILLARQQDILLESARTCRMRMKNPPMDAQEYLAALRRANLPNFADALRFHTRRLA